MISGAGFESKSKYMFGKVTVQMRLVEGDSAGTVTAFYVSLEDHQFVLPRALCNAKVNVDFFS